MLNITTYKLKEKDPEGDNLIINVYEYEGEIVGSIGEVTNYTPGMFNPSDKKGLEDVLRDRGNFQEDQIKN
ncbi:hypothetical protein [Lysinibacillus xylanilyticus]|uniref:hypothetical protein n=1 Tax=Lysinibacillus xylanilyticus TaxID=582475 RepID=UPI00381435ED